MKFLAEVTCYHCGFVSGELIGEPRGELRPESFRPSPGYMRPLPRPGEALRCGRCGGPVYLEDVRVCRPQVEKPIPPFRRYRRRRGKRRASASLQPAARSA